MKITAKNYAAQAELGLMKYIKKIDQDEYQIDIGLISAQAALIKHAVHFAVPDGGAIMDDGFRGLEGVEVRLPFPVITIEYFVDGFKGIDTDVQSPKRLVIACEVDSSVIERRGKTEIQSEKWITVYSACTLPDGLWYPAMSGWAFPCKWDQKIDCQKIIGRANESHRPVLIGHAMFLPTFYKTAVKNYGETSAIENLARDISMEVSVVMELCEALSCSNVTHEPIEEVKTSVNARRIRDGKLPIYETRCLVINALKSVASKGVKTEINHASPRQHLRRGHIRRLPEKNIWVNSCVVGDKANGVIEKQYAVRR